ncbi:unnamed protein product, partial [Meganyctiphanes norvegica]
MLMVNYIFPSRVRQHITSSSPELRTLESQLHQFYVNAENKAAIAEKALKEKKAEITEKKYMEFSEHLALEENLSHNLHKVDKRLKAMQNRRLQAGCNIAEYRTARGEPTSIQDSQPAVCKHGSVKGSGRRDASSLKKGIIGKKYLKNAPIIKRFLRK